MNNTTVYVGMDVHKESFTLCAYTLEEEKGSYSVVRQIRRYAIRQFIRG